MRVATWNINSAHILSESGKYDREDLGYIVDTLKEIDADIICLQEVDVPVEGMGMAERIGNNLGMFVEVRPLVPNHITGSGELGLAVLSKTPILQAVLRTIPVPPMGAVHSDGTPAWDGDRAFLEVVVQVGDMEVVVASGHMNPFQKFNIDPLDPKFRITRAKIERYMLSRRELPAIIAGDFNNSDLRAYIPRVFEKGMRDVLPEEPTSAKRPTKLDYIVVTSIWNCLNACVQQNKADHALCWADIERM